MKAFGWTALAWLATGSAAFAQCAMCKQALLNSAEGQRFVTGLNAGILLLLAAPFIVIGVIALQIHRACRPNSWRKIRDYVELTKPRIVAMVLVTTGIGFYLGGEGLAFPARLIAVLAGIALTAGGAAVLNNYLERDADALMERTRHRALPRGVIVPAHALGFGVLLVLGGVALLAWRVNLLTAFLALLAAFLYVLVYTPLKRVTWLNTTIGAIPGAIPPLCGWAAATGNLSAGAWALFLILFIWQHPHFYAIAWLWREDYRKAGFQMLPVVDETGRRTFRQIAGFSALLLAASLWPAILGLAGRLYVTSALVLGLMLFGFSARLLVLPSAVGARRLFFSSLVYLPVLCGLLALGR
jgi:protoheme IX farnesyltransferase